MIQKETIREIMLENRQEVERQHVVKRDIVMEDFANYVLIGVRRAGKSFLLYQQIQQYLSKGLTWDSMLYVNFEDERLIGMTAQELNPILRCMAHYRTNGQSCFSTRFKTSTVGRSLPDGLPTANTGSTSLAAMPRC